jgi:uncharacterized membrane protein
LPWSHICAPFNMQINWTILVIIILAAVALIIFLAMQNRKDEKEFEQEIKEDYKKPDVDEPEI